jgi:hypothetical protein
VRPFRPCGARAEEDGGAREEGGRTPWYRSAMRIRLASLCAPILCGAAALAALPPASASADEVTGGTSTAYSHKGQFGVHASFGLGYRALFPYDDDDYCGDDNAVCWGAPPPLFELGLAYGVSKSVELLVDMRLGLTTDFKPQRVGEDAPRPLSFDAGAKIYIDDSGSAKLFTSILFHIDRTDYSASGASQSTDYGVRNVNGLLLDFHRTFGLYLAFGETISFVRWLRFEVDAGIGVQARFP